MDAGSLTVLPLARTLYSGQQHHAVPWSQGLVHAVARVRVALHTVHFSLFLLNFVFQCLAKVGDDRHVHQSFQYTSLVKMFPIGVDYT